MFLLESIRNFLKFLVSGKGALDFGIDIYVETRNELFECQKKDAFEV